MTKNRTNLFRNIHHVSPDSSSSPPNPPTLLKRGRPATGKRSNPNWVGRTYYIQRQTDLNIEGELFHLKCQGVELDKSELVDALLAAWSQYRKSNDPNLRLSGPLNLKKSSPDHWKTDD